MQIVAELNRESELGKLASKWVRTILSCSRTFVNFFVLKFGARLSNLRGDVKAFATLMVPLHYQLAIDDPVKCKGQVQELIESGNYIYPRTAVRCYSLLCHVLTHQVS
jgi:hypothetical protein